MIFQKMIEQCGLNQIEAAEYLDYSFGAVKQWALEKRRLPDNVVLKMAKLDSQIGSIAFSIASELQKNSATIGDNPTGALLDKFHAVLQKLPAYDNVKEACLARAFIIAQNGKLTKKGNTK